MRILHLCLGSFYIDGYNYQENVLPRIHREDGNEVLVVASTETFVDNMTLGYVEPGEYVGEDGVRVIRLPYRRTLTDFITRKVRRYIGVYGAISAFAPDVIFSHSLCYASVKEVVRYVKEHPGVRLYADTHAAAYNSGTNPLSLAVLHKWFYRRLIRRALPYVTTYYYIGENERIFARDVHRVPEEKMELLSLGGLIPSPEQYAADRASVRRELGVGEDELLLIHSGKLSAEKKTLSLLSALRRVPELRARLAVIGSVPEQSRAAFEEACAADGRVVYLGWRRAEELLRYLCGCDLYCQPGSVSATLQNAVCSHAPVMCYPHLIYQRIDVGNFLFVEDEEAMVALFERFARGEIDRDALRQRTDACADAYLDYRKLAARIY